MAEKTGKELAGLAVVTLVGGEKLGRIDDVVFNPATGLITGFFVDRGGMFSKAKFLPAGDVQGLGDDALTTQSETALLDGPSAITGEVAAKTVENLPVLNPAGTVLGKVADIAVDTKALTVPYLVLTTRPAGPRPARQPASAGLGDPNRRRRQRDCFQFL